MAAVRALRKRRWDVLCRRHIEGEANSRPLPLDTGDVEHTALGTGVLSRRGRDLGNELDLGFHKGTMSAHLPPGGGASAIHAEATQPPEHNR